ncbi:hypothetical protein [Actinocatenispora rupis]|uniref:Uncharacterized protein n=1 Tax=Actinocatenispora rupis TaxID=519421 RepID=A0A8J3NHH2_9ACTN|nr:hypothetical protein [Actinocatenispora rupis]GID15959.1 hypothetical protein Aru02nite_68480 [Actinocatenispora rupis]
MIEGVLVAESLRDGGVLDGLPLRLTRVTRSRTGSATAAQPTHWTLLYVAAPDDCAEALAAALAGCLAPEGGWYCDFGTGTEKFVVFADRVFRYARGDRAAGDRAREYARSVGVPGPQLDWAD